MVDVLEVGYYVYLFGVEIGVYFVVVDFFNVGFGMGVVGVDGDLVVGVGMGVYVEFL